MTGNRIHTAARIKRRYIKPEYKLETRMTFMFDAIKKQQMKQVCRQCCSCHGCR